METGQAGSGRPMRRPSGGGPPEAFGQQLRTAHDAVLIGIGIHIDHPEDFEDGVGEVRVPAAGAEAHLSERLPVFERQGRERLGGGQIAGEGDIAEAWHQLVPELLAS